MENELKSDTVVLLRAELTGHGHPSPFCQNRWDDHAPDMSELKKTPIRVDMVGTNHDKVLTQ